MTLSVDLAKEALKELRFLAVINQHQELLESGNALKLAIYRCVRVHNTTGKKHVEPHTQSHTSAVFFLCCE